METIRLGGSEFAAGAAERLAAILRACARDRAGAIAVALSGGRTPQPTHAALGAAPDMPWDRVRLFFADERGVPPDHPDSNFGMARASLLSRAPIPPAQVFRMEAERPDRDAAAEEYAALLPEVLDLLVLGLGTDGHTCSLFPHSAAVRELHRRVVPSDSPQHPHPRLTITRPVIARARHVVMLVRGADRADAVRRALFGPLDVDACPGQVARDGLWIVDLSS